MIYYINAAKFKNEEIELVSLSTELAAPSLRLVTKNEVFEMLKNGDVFYTKYYINSKWVKGRPVEILANKYLSITSDETKDDLGEITRLKALN